MHSVVVFQKSDSSYCGNSKIRFNFNRTFTGKMKYDNK